jgi:hypothetical protein
MNTDLAMGDELLKKTGSGDHGLRRARHPHNGSRWSKSPYGA